MRMLQIALLLLAASAATMPAATVDDALKTKLTVQFVDLSVVDAAAALQRKTGVHIQVTSDPAKPEPTITVSGELTLAQILDAISAKTGLQWAKDDAGGIVIQPAAATPAPAR